MDCPDRTTCKKEGDGVKLERIEHADDERIVAFSGLRDAVLRTWPGTPHGLFMGESRKVIERALDAGYAPHSMLVEDAWLERSRDLVERIRDEHAHAPVYLCTHDVFSAVTGFQITRCSLAAFYRKPLPALEDVLAGARRVAVIEDVTNYTNIGAIFRSAAALGIDAVLVTPSCHDPLYHRAARVSMGTVFQVPWTRIGSKRAWGKEGIALLHEHGFEVASLALADESVPLDDPELAACPRLALVLGTEGDGLAPATLAESDFIVKIPMAHGVDSLNVAAASAVAFWELRPKNA